MCYPNVEYLCKVGAVGMVANSCKTYETFDEFAELFSVFSEKGEDNVPSSAKLGFWGGITVDKGQIIALKEMKSLSEDANAGNFLNNLQAGSHTELYLKLRSFVERSGKLFGTDGYIGATQAIVLPFFPSIMQELKKEGTQQVTSRITGEPIDGLLTKLQKMSVPELIKACRGIEYRGQSKVGLRLNNLKTSYGEQGKAIYERATKNLSYTDEHYITDLSDDLIDNLTDIPEKHKQDLIYVLWDLDTSLAMIDLATKGSQAKVAELIKSIPLIADIVFSKVLDIKDNESLDKLDKNKLNMLDATFVGLFLTKKESLTRKDESGRKLFWETDIPSMLSSSFNSFGSRLEYLDKLLTLGQRLDGFNLSRDEKENVFGSLGKLDKEELIKWLCASRLGEIASELVKIKAKHGEDSRLHKTAEAYKEKLDAIFSGNTDNLQGSGLQEYLIGLDGEFEQYRASVIDFKPDAAGKTVKPTKPSLVLPPIGESIRNVFAPTTHMAHDSKLHQIISDHVAKGIVGYINDDKIGTKGAFITAITNKFEAEIRANNMVHIAQGDDRRLHKMTDRMAEVMYNELVYLSTLEKIDNEGFLSSVLNIVRNIVRYTLDFFTDIYHGHNVRDLRSNIRDNLVDKGIRGDTDLHQKLKDKIDKLEEHHHNKAGEKAAGTGMENTGALSSSKSSPIVVPEASTTMTDGTSTNTTQVQSDIHAGKAAEGVGEEKGSQTTQTM